MPQYLAAIAYLVRDYDEAIAYFVGTLGFTLAEDTPQPGSDGKRFVRVAPPAATTGATATPAEPGQCSLLLARAKNATELAAIGNQTGGRVFLFLHTDDFERDYQRYRDNGVEFTEAPRDEVYGKVVVFRDLYGNKWDLVEKR